MVCKTEMVLNTHIYTYESYIKLQNAYNELQKIFKLNKKFKRYLMKWVVSKSVTMSEKETIKESLKNLKVTVKTIINSVVSNIQSIITLTPLRNILEKIGNDVSQNARLCQLISVKKTV